MCEKVADENYSVRGNRNEPSSKPSGPKTKTSEQALAALMRYASRAERSSGDAERLMRNWNVPEPERQAILERLKRMKFIDDARFAAAYVRDKSEFAGWGSRKIRTGLISKGIDRQIIDSVLGELKESGSENCRLDELIARKLNSLKTGTTYEKKGKLLRFGLSRGYGYDAVMESVDKAFAAGNNDE